MKMFILVVFALLLSACMAAKTPPTTGFAIIDIDRVGILEVECTASQCSCDVTAPETSTRTCAGISAICKALGAKTLTCELTGTQTCTCTF